jgi:uncharacterized protein (TIGR02757 family)
MLDELRAKYNRREFVHPDPLEFLYAYEDLRDREVVGLIASSLAYGRVKCILRSVARVLERMDPPARFLDEVSDAALFDTFRDFRHRVTSGETLSVMLLGAKRVISHYGTLGACFKAGLGEEDETVFPALARFVDELTLAAGRCPTHLLPAPDKGGACKRLNLFLRWMVRCDEVDPGGWPDVPAAKLVIPLDTHMHAMGRRLGFTKRKQADRRTALEITSAFRSIAPDDPVRYDFALTRLGIRKDADLEGFPRASDMMTSSARGRARRSSGEEAD